MNELQSKLLEIFKEFDRVCSLLNLKYFAIGGTALGAQRHSGFIPWDDDMDFGMLRKDYEVFKKEAPRLIKEKYFIQTSETDKEWLAPFMKIRDCSTTAVETILRNKNINHGLWIDVFPIDNISDNAKEFKRFSLKRRILIRRLVASYKYPFSVKRSLLNFVIRIMVPSKYHASKKLNNDYLPLFKKDTKRVANCYVFKNKLPVNCPSKWFDDIKKVKFEDTWMNIIDKNVEYLETKYGNWQVLPPLENRKSLHSTCFIDLNMPCNEYAKKLKN